jgi:hypothetical protein
MNRTVAAWAVTLAVSVFVASAFARVGGRGVRDQQPPNRPRQERSGGKPLEQPISDQGQLMTIAFDGLAFLTGNLGCCTFLPPGKVSDYFGFQYKRGMSHEEHVATISRGRGGARP